MLECRENNVHGLGCVVKGVAHADIAPIIFRLQEEMLQKEDVENTLRSFRQVCVLIFSAKIKISS